MKIIATEMDHEFVSFNCSIGKGIGTCYEENISKDSECDVEIDLKIDLRLGFNFEKSNQKTTYWTTDNDVNHIYALVESIDEDGTLCLRLSDDCIIVTTYELRNISPGELLFIKTKKDDLELTLTGI